MKKIFIVVAMLFLLFGCDTAATYKNSYIFYGYVVDATYGYYLPNIYVDYDIYDITDKLIYLGRTYTDKYGYFEIYGRHNKDIEELYKLDLYFYSDYYIIQRNTSYYEHWVKKDSNVSYRIAINLKRK